MQIFFKYSEHITIFQTLSVDIWQLICQQTINRKWRFRCFYWIYLFIYNLQNSQVFLPYPLKRIYFLIKSVPTNSKNRRLCKTCTNVDLFSVFSQTFNFRDQNVVDQLSKKYCLYYVYEHLKYYTQINIYWLNKNVCLNIVKKLLNILYFKTYYF